MSRIPKDAPSAKELQGLVDEITVAFVTDAMEAMTAWSRSEADDKQAAKAALSRANAWREQAGLGPLGWDFRAHSAKPARGRSRGM
jgi:uncharacterized protein YkwD